MTEGLSEHGSQSQLLDTADRLLGNAEKASVPLRLIGGLAIFTTCPSAQLPELARTYPDMDLVTARSTGRVASTFLTEQGYVADRRFNALHGATRLLFYEESGAWQIDVFVGLFSMCHKLDFEGRFLPGYRILPLADLLLTKLQIVQLNLKDLKDIVTILLDHNVSDQESPDTIDLTRLIAVSSVDWGLFTTVSESLLRVKDEVGHILDAQRTTMVVDRVGYILSGIRSAPKSRGWRMRSRVGRRVAWYDLPDEVTR
jgi:hypothetical protein